MAPPAKTTGKRGRVESPAPEPSNKRAKINKAGTSPTTQQRRPPQEAVHDGAHNFAPEALYPTSFHHTGVPAALAGFRARLAQQSANPNVQIGGIFTLDDARLQIPSGLAPAESRRRCAAMIAEAKFQEQHPPILPVSKIQPVTPKEQIEDFLDFPEDLDGVERERRVRRNNEIAGKLQRIDRERNNQAAKRSRQTRLESLNNTRVLLNEKTAECAWFRLKLMAAGGSAQEWDQVPAEVKTAMMREISERVNLVEQERLEHKKKLESEQRQERNKARVAEKNRHQGVSASPIPALQISFPGDEAAAGDPTSLNTTGVNMADLFPEMSATADMVSSQQLQITSDLLLPNPTDFSTSGPAECEDPSNFTDQLQNLSQDFHLPSDADNDNAPQQS